MSEQYLAENNPWKAHLEETVSAPEKGVFFFQISDKTMSQHGANIQCTAWVVISQMKYKTTFLSVHRGLRSHDAKSSV